MSPKTTLFPWTPPVHNRWHPEIPPVSTVRPGERFRVDCRDWFDGAVGNDESVGDVLTAPFRVEGARPGDLLVVDIVDVGPRSEGGCPYVFVKGQAVYFPKRFGGSC